MGRRTPGQLHFLLWPVVLLLALAGDMASAQVELHERVSLRIDDRIRTEIVDWFEPDAPGNPERYTFFANRLRVSASLTLPRLQFFVQVQDTRIGNLPGDAIVPPVGALGTGAIYLAHTRDRWQGETVLSQAYGTVRARGTALTVGRFSYAEGAETSPGNPTLAFMKRTRISERLVGPFDFTHNGRRVDGARVAWNRGAWNLTAIGARPTRGGFEVSANRHLDKVAFANGAVTYTGSAPGTPIDARLFYLYFDDRRASTTKADNRPSADRSADHESIQVHTLGGHVLAEIETGPGLTDLLFWFAVQNGDWGQLDHRAWAFAMEGGYQFSRVWSRPWLRIGYNVSSGDDDPADSEHRTFLTPLPTARKYARFPFFNNMNLQDIFAQIFASPTSAISVRADYHWLQLAESSDLWYAGGGATNQRVFGIGGLPSGGSANLGHLVDLSVDYRWNKHLSVGTYVGQVFGGDVITNNFAAKSATYGFIELRLSF